MSRMFFLSVILVLASGLSAALPIRSLPSFEASLPEQVPEQLQKLFVGFDTTKAAERLAAIAADLPDEKLRTEVSTLVEHLRKNEVKIAVQAYSAGAERFHEGAASGALKTAIVVIAGMLFALWGSWYFGLFEVRPDSDLADTRTFAAEIVSKRLELNISALRKGQQGQVVQLLGFLRWHSEQMIELLRVFVSLTEKPGEVVISILKALHRCGNLFDWGCVPAVSPEKFDYQVLVDKKVKDELGRWYELERNARLNKENAESAQRDAAAREKELARRWELLERDFDALCELQKKQSEMNEQADETILEEIVDTPPGTSAEQAD